MIKLTKVQKTAMGLVMLVLFVVFIGIIGSVFNKNPSYYSTDYSEKHPSKIPKSNIRLNADVKFTGTQFIITNQDSFGWTGVNIDINGGFLSSGYVFNVGYIGALKTVTIGALQFAKKNGERFNPFLMKPLKIEISCNLVDRKGFYSGKWE